METKKCPNRFQNSSIRLNRTMQYGNQFLHNMITDEGVCLNRTMQYGNSDKNFIERISLREFKSYYVVWKQIELKTKKVGNTMFKSYYVVWKRAVACSFGCDG